MSIDKKQQFPNGILSWIETHHEVVSAIAIEMHDHHGPHSPVLQARANAQGTGGLYEIGQELTDKFEALTEGVSWEEKEYFEEIESFIHDELYPATK